MLDPERLLESLNPQQHHAVTQLNDSALILAGAGSGKTRVLTTHIAWLLASGHCSSYGILAVTFTNKAAKEMLARLHAMLPFNPRNMWIGTFHGLCHRLLRTHAHDAGLPPQFTILDMQDQLALIKRVLKTQQIDPDKYPPRKLQYFINRHKESGQRASDLHAPDPYTRTLIEIYAAYDAQCQKEQVVDFSELLLRSFELLSHNLALRVHYQQRFQHILIDEFQDTNALQYAWLKLLASDTARVFAVGDDDQSIYTFRGAEVGNMQRLLHDFHIENPIRLEQNYRSTRPILDAANAVIAHNTDRLGKTLWTQHDTGEPVRLTVHPSDQAEAQQILSEIQTLIQNGLSPDQIAVLYRSNAQSRVFEHAFFQSSIPYRVYGGVRFYERQEIKHALAYIRLALNPHDNHALLRVVNIPTRGIGMRTLEILQLTAQTHQCSLWDAIHALSGRTASKLLAFASLIQTFDEHRQNLPFPELISYILEASGLNAMYRTERDGNERLENLTELINAAISFQPENPSDIIEEFLAHAALEAGEYAAQPGQAAVQLMTVHAAKGLEFDSVFVVGLEEGLFPHENALHEPLGIEEERRLMYVAMTRARQRLYLSHAYTRLLHGQLRHSLRSRFIDEIPSTLCRTIGFSASSATRAAPIAKHAVSSAQMPDGYTLGQSVEHSHFGRGVVTAAEVGNIPRIQVNFVDHGEKWLDLRFAHLNPL